MSTYLFDNGHLIIKDLQIFFEDQYDYVSLPEDREDTTDLPCGYTLGSRLSRDHCLQELWLENQGKRDGQACQYYKDGTLLGRCYYKQGNLHGPSIFYAKQGQVLSRTWYFLGKKQGLSERFYLEGKRMANLFYCNDQQEGEQEYFYENGKSKTKLFYKKGALEGKVQLYHTTGMPSRELSYSDGKRKGVERQWNEDGKIVVECEYDGQELVGVSRRWHSNGELAEEVNYLLPGKSAVKQWSCDGVLLRHAYYDDNDRYYHKIFSTTGELKQEQRGYWDGEKLCSGDPVG